MKKLIDVYDEYIELLISELSEIVAFAHAHGWRSSRHEQGIVLREKIATLKEEVAKTHLEFCEEYCEIYVCGHGTECNTCKSAWNAATNAAEQKFTSTNSDYMAVLQSTLNYYHSEKFDKTFIAVIMARFKQNLNDLKADHCI